MNEISPPICALDGSSALKVGDAVVASMSEVMDKNALLTDLLDSDFYKEMDVPRGEKIVVAMSGGVDSSVTAALLHHAGYEVVGLTLQLYDHGAAVSRKKACCAGQDIYDAKKVAAALGIPHYVMDMESRFKEAVIQDFADSYAKGETPVPCIRCNQTVKFHDLLSFAKSLGAKALATGHYVRRKLDEQDKFMLFQGKDSGKDQSYFLFATTPAQLDFLRFPLGGLDKAQTRALAAYFKLSNADKPDSQDICFVPNGNYAGIVARLRPDAFIPGDIIDMKGKILGKHQGIAHFTVGQRKGIGIGGRQEGGGAHATGDNAPLYVIALNAKTAQVVVGERHHLAIGEIYIKEVNWLGDEAEKQPMQSSSGFDSAFDIEVKIRNNMPSVPARLEFLQHDHARISFASPIYGVSSGQACVFYRPHAQEKNGYDPKPLLGGGWITDTSFLNAAQG